MNIQRQIRLAALVGLGSGLIGCQSPMGGVPFWSKGDPVASASPDVGKQKYEGLAQEFGGSRSKSPSSGMGGSRQEESGNFLTSTWSKTTGAVASVFSSKKTTPEQSDDPTSLNTKSKKVGPEVYIAAARLLENQGKLAEAQQQYEAAVHAKPTDLNALVGLARLQDRQGNGTQAIELYQKAAKAHPKSPLVQNDMGLCLARQRQWQPSLAALNKAIELQPGEAKYRNNMAMVLVDMGRPDDALPHLAALSNPAIAHYNLGYLLQQKGQRDLAVRHLQQAAALDGNLAPAREMLAQLGSPLPDAGAPPEMRMAVRPASVPLAPPAIQMPPAQPSAYAPPAYSQPAYSPPAAAPIGTTPTGSAQGASYQVGDDSQASPSRPQSPVTGSSYYEGVADDEGIKPLPPVEN